MRLCLNIYIYPKHKDKCHFMTSDGNCLSVTWVKWSFLSRRESVWIFIINLTVLVKLDLKDLANGDSGEGGSPNPFPLFTLRNGEQGYPCSLCFPFLPAWTSTCSNTSCEVSGFLPAIRAFEKSVKVSFVYSYLGNPRKNYQPYFWQWRFWKLHVEHLHT